MRLMILLAITTTACMFYILHPLMKSKHAKLNEMGTFLLFAMPIAALILYLLLGSPDIASRPALFETTGPRHEYRMVIKKEMDLMHELARHPDDRNIMVTIGTLRLQTGRPGEAIDILRTALDQHPDDRLVAEELGAAHYAAAIMMLQNLVKIDPESRLTIGNHFENAIHYTPKDALFRQELEDNYSAFKALK